MVELPSGTVSMLFSDLEQSTRLLTRLGERYVEVLDGCRRVQRAAWSAFDGIEMGTEGDSFFVVFRSAANAVGAAVQAQTALSELAWPDDEQVRVRMGIHTGSPRVHDDGYVGMDVHRAARIAASAHGGQVVISDATAALLAEGLASGATLRDLGKHRLKDLSQPEHLHQLVIQGLPNEHPPLRSLGTISSLPATTSSLIGRESQIAELEILLSDPEVRLVTLVGPGGAGKTRLSIASAARVVEHFPDGVFFVPLAALTTAEGVWSTLGETLELPPDARTESGLLSRIARQAVLLVLDNLEQVDGVDAAVDTLLRSAPTMAVLATSRRPLHLSGERQYVVPPLTLPAADTLSAAEASAAVTLFVQRARSVRAPFALTAENASDVASICRVLDGLPLAIELAAAKSKVLGPRALLSRLEQELDVRVTGADRPDRQRGLRATIDWSYRLLPPEQQVLLRRLGVFAGGADLGALAAVCGNGAVASEPLDLAAELVDASLATVTEGPDGEPRFGMLETVRAFALEELRRADELEEVRRLHAVHYVTRAAPLDRHRVLTTREHMAKELTTFRLELQNFRAVLAWATSPPDLPEPVPHQRRALALAVLAKVWWILMHRDPGDCRHWLEATLEQPGPNDTADVGRCLLGHAEVVGLQADWSRARESARRSVTILQAQGDPGLPEALGALGVAEIQLGDEPAGRRALEQAVHEARRLGDDRLVGDALAGLASHEVQEENWEQALDLLDEALRRYPAGADDYGGGQAVATIAIVLHKLGRAVEAHAQLSAHLFRWMHHESSLNLASYAEDYLVMLAEAGFAELTPLLLGACDAERDRLGLTRDAVDEAQVAAASTPARAEMTQAEWSDTYARGRGMLIKDALAEAISATTDLPAQPTPSPGSSARPRAAERARPPKPARRRPGSPSA